MPDVPGAAAEFHHAEGEKCARCWMILPEVGKNPSHADLCNRCTEAVDAWGRHEGARFRPAWPAAWRWSLDQGSKLLMLYGFGFAHMGPGQSVPVLPFFNLVMVWNPGITMACFPPAGPKERAFWRLFSLSRWAG